MDRQDRLWIGTNDFGLFLLEKGSLRRVDRKDQSASASIRSIVEDSEGVMVVGSAAGVYTVDTDLKVAAVEDERLAASTIVELRAGVGGLIYGITQEGDLFTLKAGGLHAWLEHEACGLGNVKAILPDFANPGAPYLATEDPGTKSARIHHGTPEDRFASAQVVDIAPLSYVERMEILDGGAVDLRGERGRQAERIGAAAAEERANGQVRGPCDDGL